MRINNIDFNIIFLYLYFHKLKLKIFFLKKDNENERNNKIMIFKFDQNFFKKILMIYFLIILKKNFN